MLKKELEEKLREAEQTVNHIRGVITEVSRRALENNCSEAIGYVAEIDGVLNLDITRTCYMNLCVEIPIQCAEAFENVRYDFETSWELTYKGKVIPFDIEQFDIAEY